VICRKYTPALADTEVTQPVVGFDVDSIFAMSRAQPKTGFGPRKAACRPGSPFGLTPIRIASTVRASVVGCAGKPLLPQSRDPLRTAFRDEPPAEPALINAVIALTSRNRTSIISSVAALVELLLHLGLHIDQ
jgi:hypothetical protein